MTNIFRITLLFGLVTQSCSLSLNEAALNGSPTYHGQVKQILTDHCIGCHQNGGLAPFPLDTYKSAKNYAGSIVDSTHSRRMPPFGANDSGECNTFQDSNWLSDQELLVLKQWKEIGKPEGIPSEDSKTTLKILSIENPDLELTPLIPHTPEFNDSDGDGEFEDTFYCYILPYEESITRNLSEIQFVPGIGAEPQDHHAITAQMIDPVAEIIANFLDNKTPEPGFPCDGTGVIFSGTNIIDVWAPGMNPRKFPDGVGIEMQPQKSILIQIHYSLALTDTPAEDAFKIQMNFTDKPIAKIKSLAPDSGVDFTLPQGKTTISNEFVMPESGKIISFLPHMHLLGRSFDAQLIEGNQESCLVQVPRYDFDWQQMYFLKEPIQIGAGDKIRLNCHYDNQTGSDVESGDDSNKEMCLFLFYYF